MLGAMACGLTRAESTISAPAYKSALAPSTPQYTTNIMDVVAYVTVVVKKGPDDAPVSPAGCAGMSLSVLTAAYSRTSIGYVVDYLGFNSKNRSIHRA